MINNVESIPVEKFIEVTNEHNATLHEEEWNGLTLTIKDHLSMADMFTFANDVVTLCFDSETGAYRPEVKDFAIRLSIIEMYSNLELPENTNAKYNIVYSSDICSFILDYVNPGQWNSLLTSINKKIDNLAQANVEAVSVQMNQLMGRLDILEDQIGEVFDGVDGDTMNLIADAVAGGTFDKKKIVSEVIEQLSEQDEE